MNFRDKLGMLVIGRVVVLRECLLRLVERTRAGVVCMSIVMESLLIIW